MLPQEFWIRNVEIWNAGSLPIPAQDLFVKDGVIEKILPHAGQFEQNDFDGKGKVLMPSGVDLQVHLRVPGQSQKETPETGLRAALKGGYGAVLTMPNTQPVLDSADKITGLNIEIDPWVRKFGVKVMPSAAMTLSQEGQKVVDGLSLKNAGAFALTDDGVGVSRDEIMEEVLKESHRSGLPVLQHAEVPGHGGVLAPGPTQAKLGLKAYDEAAEIDMVKRDIGLVRKLYAEYPKLRYHVLHVSAAKTLDLVKEAKAQGLPVTCEVTPHHLFFSSSDIPEDMSSFKMNPPLRGENDKKRLIEELSTKLVDFVSTDHAPHEPARKGKDFRAAAFGTTGLETSLLVLLDLYNKGKLSSSRLVEVFSKKPAEFIGISNKFGSLGPQKPLNAVLVDVSAPDRKIELSDLESLSKNNCFIGARLPGKVMAHFNESGLFRF